MSATVMYYPQQYVDLMDVMRARLLVGRPEGWAPNIKIGLQMNYNKLCACITEDAIHPEFENSLAKVGAANASHCVCTPMLCCGSAAVSVVPQLSAVLYARTGYHLETSPSFAFLCFMAQNRRHPTTS